nr:1,4-dihydroxy-2-naphthoate polyprenyltransferase [Vibrio maerlii]
MKQSIQIWLDAARPKTLPLALAAIITGSSLAFASGHFSLPIALLCLLTATLLQILSNLANDYGDAEKGTDNDQRLGPMRAIQSGAVSLKDMKQAIGINIVFICLSGLALLFYSLDSLQNFFIFIALGILSIVAALAYTMGSKPYGYAGLGDLSVFIFFGLLGVCGTYFLHTAGINPDLLLPAIGSGLFAVAVLNVNNMRDIENDAECGKKTLAVRLGSEKAKRYHTQLLFGGLTSFVLFLAVSTQPISAFLMLIAVPVILKHQQAINRAQKPIEIAPMMPDVVKCAMISNLLFSLVVIAQTLLSN